MKKLAFFLALFVGLNASVVARKPEEEEENQAVIVKDSSRQSTAAWIHSIADKLKACYYGITKDGFIHELGWELIHKIKRTHLDQNHDIDSLLEAKSKLNSAYKSKLIWVHFSYQFENGNESWELDTFVKEDGKWECITKDS